MDCQHCEAKSGRAANDLTVQQWEPQFRGESWTTVESPLCPTKVSFPNLVMHLTPEKVTTS